VQFITIRTKSHQDIAIRFRKDSFRVSFGSSTNFDEQDYLIYLKEKTNEFPDGFVLVKENDEFIGQLELSIREYEGKRIGYVHLYYLIENMRGKGKGSELHSYTKQFFKKHGVTEFHLRVSPTNESAINFYRKLGSEKIGPEVDGKVIRMKGRL
jgi:RimJ/RimL family protein N-acetyltransferase